MTGMVIHGDSKYLEHPQKYWAKWVIAPNRDRNRFSAAFKTTKQSYEAAGITSPRSRAKHHMIRQLVSILCNAYMMLHVRIEVACHWLYHASLIYFVCSSAREHHYWTQIQWPWLQIARVRSPKRRSLGLRVFEGVLRRTL